MDLVVQENEDDLMDVNSFETDAEVRFDDCLKILVNKRRLYGTQNIVDQGVKGVIGRIRHDKMARLANIVETNALRETLASKYRMPKRTIDEYVPAPDTNDESVIDTLMDIANYAMIAIALLEGWWQDE